MTAAARNGTTSTESAVECLIPVWPGASSAGRHGAYRALAGGLLRDRLPLDDAERFVEALVEATDDAEIRKRVELVADTAKKLKEKRPTTGFPKLAEMLGTNGPAAIRNLRLRLGLTITLEALAAHKRLPAAYLKTLGLHDLDLGGVGIPYHAADCRLEAVKARYSLRAGDRSYWPAGTPVMAYGEWRDDAQA